jgi:hypothetical protein
VFNFEPIATWGYETAMSRVKIVFGHAPRRIIDWILLYVSIRRLLLIWRCHRQTLGSRSEFSVLNLYRIMPALALLVYLGFAVSSKGPPYFVVAPLLADLFLYS